VPLTHVKRELKIRITKEEYEATVNTEPLKIEHVCWFVKDEGYDNLITLMEVVKLTYKHPCAPDYAFHYQQESRAIKTVKRNSEDGGVIVLMEANQKAITNQMRKEHENT
jgi:hypothetical protein